MTHVHLVLIHCLFSHHHTSIMVYNHVIIDLLPNDVLLCIFSCHRSLCRNNCDPRLLLLVTWKWHRLAHVCWRWQNIIFASPHHLGLRLVVNNTPTLGSKPCKQALDHWPTVPISIWYDWGRLSPKHEDEVAAALEHPDRIYKIKLEMAKSTLAKLPAWVEASFPALEILHLNSLNYNP